MASFPGQLGKLGKLAAEGKIILDFNQARDDRVAVAVFKYRMI